MSDDVRPGLEMAIRLVEERPDLREGLTYDVAYPFVRDKFFDGESDVDTWRPGTRPEHVPATDDVEFVADAMGAMEMTVVSIHKPGRYPTRVFFTRKFVSPDGRRFGRDSLRIATMEKVRRLVSGYQHPFVMAPAILSDLTKEREAADA